MSTKFPLLNIQQLGYRIDKNVILQNLDLKVRRGIHVALAGENGAGKSTLIKLILDLIRNRTSGNINIDGIENRKVSARDSICYLPEKFEVKKELTGQQYLEFISRMNFQALNHRTVETLCEQLGFDSSRLVDKAGNYSKGMKQKLGLISCFMLDKPLMILDEPLSGLDPKARFLFKRLMEKERESGRTIFYSTHMLADAEELCDRFAILHEGRIVFEGTPAECMARFSASSLEQAYMRCISPEAA